MIPQPEVPTMNELMKEELQAYTKGQQQLQQVNQTLEEPPLSGLLGTLQTSLQNRLKAPLSSENVSPDQSNKPL
jgi:hypothetical protein